MLRRRGYALTPARLAAVCLGGPLPESEVRWAVGADPCPLASVVVNVLGVVHAMRHRAKAVDDLTRRPVAPRLMTVNLVLERSQCRPLARQDEDMAFELVMAEPVFGLGALNDVVTENPALLEHFPQLADLAAPLLIGTPRRASPRR